MSVLKLQIPIRKLKKSDYNKKYLNLLEQLTDCPQLSLTQFESIYEQLSENHSIYVIEKDNIIVTTITLMREVKFIHGGKYVLHIEDVVVDKNYRGLGYGKKILQHALQYAKDNTCYKIILNCALECEHFYHKLGFKSKNIEMSQYLSMG
tara:strand:- start:1971 stop:2420 length:450 start_codon:yes stop_codon:yes gene_type:complete